MILKALKYKSGWLRYEWSIKSGTSNNEFVEFENINLIVGRNASGKTRFIEAIRWISDLFDEGVRAGSLPQRANSFEIIFQNGNDEVKYNLAYDLNEFIFKENLFINNSIKLDRGKGKLYYEQLNQFLDFKTDDHSLVVNRKDNLQQPFFEVLQNWGKNLSHYSFGGKMGKTEIERIGDFEGQDLINFKKTNYVKTVYRKALNEFQSEFEKIIIEDMMRIDYTISSISLEDISTHLFLSVQESDLDFPTLFDSMSQGMARAFSLIVQLNYSLMAKIPSCILIDDIGEGLDYDRSKKLIELIIEKAEGSNIQVFMTTNDRFVMNSVPLKYWSVIHREGNKSVFYNYQNSKQTFDDFAFTGLNNFDFFATEFYRQGFEEFIATAQ